MYVNSRNLGAKVRFSGKGLRATLNLMRGAYRLKANAPLAVAREGGRGEIASSIPRGWA